MVPPDLRPTIDDVIEGFALDALGSCPARVRRAPGVGRDRHRGGADARISWPRSERAACTGSTRACRARRYGADQVTVPSKITLFRDRSAQLTGAGALAAGVADTVYHEIAHHFGISDARLHELQDRITAIDRPAERVADVPRSNVPGRLPAMTDQRPLRGLRGKRVYLRPLEPEDAELVATWYADDRVRGSWAIPRRAGRGDDAAMRRPSPAMAIRSSVS